MTKTKVIIACDSFKGTLSSADIGNIFKSVADTSAIDIETVSIGDGGEGTVTALCHSLGATMVETIVSDPLGRPVKAAYAVTGDTALMEVAAACGLTLLSRDRLNPMVACSRGVGEMILDALDRGCRRFIIGVGGTATVDGGAGMLTALGARILDRDGNRIAPGGGGLASVDTISLAGLDPRLAQSRLTIACDVDAPLTGDDGAATVFGPQKGATPAMVGELDRGLTIFAAAIRKASSVDITGMKGAGAAGGIAGALAGCCGASLVKGIDLVLDTIGFDDMLQGASLVVTGEGHIDRQTLMGKAAAGVLRHAAGCHVPALLICGCVDPGLPLPVPVVNINDGCPMDSPPARAAALDPDVARLRMTSAARHILEHVSQLPIHHVSQQQ